MILRVSDKDTEQLPFRAQTYLTLPKATMSTVVPNTTSDVSIGPGHPGPQAKPLGNMYGNMLMNRS